MWLNKLAKRFLVEFPAEVAKVFFSLVSESFEGVDWLVGVAQVSPPSPESSSSLIELLGEAGLGSTSLTASSAFLAASSSLEIVEEHSDATVRLDSGRSESVNQSLDKWTKAKLGTLDGWTWDIPICRKQSQGYWLIIMCADLFRLHGKSGLLFLWIVYFLLHVQQAQRHLTEKSYINPNIKHAKLQIESFPWFSFWSWRFYRNFWFQFYFN